MGIEHHLAEFVHEAAYDDVPDDVVRIIKRVLLSAIGTGVAGAGEDGVAELHEFYRSQGGRAEATLLVHGDRLPAAAAAMLNGVMCRALDFCDAMAPGLHIGSSLVPAAFAAAELAGGCSGKEFLAALAAGSETASRMNLSEQAYDGFDPTGVAAVFASTAAAAKLLGLHEHQTLHALALAFNRSGGSFQSNVDGSLAVRIIQGWAAETGITCARMARAGLTGPPNFISGVYGYGHLFARDRDWARTAADGLGQDFKTTRMVFKKYPSCGLTQGATEVTLRILESNPIQPGDIRGIDVRLPPYAYRLVGHEFKIGENPRVNAQFSAQYCIASAIVRGSAKLEHFRDGAIRDPAVLALAARVNVTSDDALAQRGHTAVDVEITTATGRKLADGLDIAPGFPGNPLPDEAYLARFMDCMDYAECPLPAARSSEIVATVDAIESVDDIRPLLALTVQAEDVERKHRKAVG